jgi:hypothetical protein
MVGFASMAGALNSYHSAHPFPSLILYKSLTKSGDNGATAPARAALLIGASACG